MSRLDSRPLVVAGLCASVVATLCGGAGVEAPAAEQPPAVTMVVQPQPAPQPALRYTLLPEFLDQTPGNAVPLYFIATNLMAGNELDAVKDALDAALHQPLAELVSDDARSLVERHQTVLDQVELAARRETCVWDLPTRQQGLHMHLPSLGNFRMLARLVALQARLQIADGHTDEACRSLQTGLAMARHMAEAPTLINAVVAAAMTELMLDRIPELAQNPDAPNLYWALTNLPQPFIDNRRAIQFETSILYLSLPELRGLANVDLTPEQAQGLLDSVVRLTDSREHDWRARFADATTAITVYPAAKQHLASVGYTMTRIEAMPIRQAILLYWLDQYVRARDDVVKWFSLPYWQAVDGLRTDPREEHPDSNTNPCFAVLPSPLLRFYAETTVPDRRIAALRCVEAIRLHAAAHDGRPPKRLEDITLVPVPIDPITGVLFRYEVDANRFVLEGPVPEGLSPRHGLRYEVTLAE